MSLAPGTHKDRMLILGVIVALGLLLVTATWSSLSPAQIRGSLFARNAISSDPTTGIYISKNYEAQPNERGSVLLEAGQPLIDFEALFLTISVDPSEAEIVHVRRTAVTEDYEVSTSFPAPGVARVALVGEPRQINPGFGMLDIELKLKDSSQNVVGDRIDLVLLGTEYVVEDTRVLDLSHDGRVTIVTSQNALDVPFTPTISDVEPNAISLVRGAELVIRGQALPSVPHVFIGSQNITVTSASPTQIRAIVPETIPPGTYTVSVDSVVADETVTIIQAPGPSGSVDVLEDVMFFSPNPARFNANEKQSVVLWVPVYNPLGASDSVTVSVDLSPLGGDPNITFTGVGETALGPGGSTINWFRVPQSGEITLPDFLQTDADYPILVRAENRSGSIDQATAILQLRSQGSQSNAPSIGTIDVVPTLLFPGDDVSFFVDVSDAEGIDTLQIVSMRTTALGGGLIELDPVFNPAQGNVPLTTMTFEAEFTVPNALDAGDYPIIFTARDQDGNESTNTVLVTISQPGVTGGPVTDSPRQEGRLEAIPSVAAPSEEVTFVATFSDTDGSDTIEHVTIDLVDLFGTVEEMDVTVDPVDGSTEPVTYDFEYELPETVPVGAYTIQVRAVDEEGKFTTAIIPLTVSAQAVSGDLPVIRDIQFVPETVAPGGEARLYVEIEDLNGIDDDFTVFANFTEIELEAEELDPIIDPPSGTVLRKNTFASDRITIPEDLQQGVYDIEVTVVDTASNLIEDEARLRVQKGGEDEGQPPRIDPSRTFQTPRTVPNDDSTTADIHILVSDPDDDAFVIANLGNIGRASSASVSGDADGIDLLCGESRAIVCLSKGAPEDTGSRWFILEDILIPPTTLPGIDPYEIEITAIDAEGHIDEAVIPLYVGDEDTEDRLQQPTEILAVVPVDSDELEVLFSAPLATDSVDRAGNQFIIQQTLQAFSSLSVQRISWDSSGRILYMQTDPLTPGEVYTLRVRSSLTQNIGQLTDVYGNRFSADRGGTAVFTAFSFGDEPQIESVRLSDSTHLDVRFTDQVLPSSIHPEVIPVKTTIRSQLDGSTVRVLRSEIRDGSRTLHLETTPMREGDSYEITIEGVLSPGLVSAPGPGVRKIFTAAFHRAADDEKPRILPTADLNQDGRVDFADFAIFSSVYSTQYDVFDARRNPPEVQHGSAPEQDDSGRRNLGGELPPLEF